MNKQTNRANTIDIDAGAEPLRLKPTDALTLDYQAESDREEAGKAGAFGEGALSEQDVTGSSADLAKSEPTPVFIEDGNGLDIPANITIANARTLLRKKPGESVKDAVARLAMGQVQEEPAFLDHDDQNSPV